MAEDVRKEIIISIKTDASEAGQDVDSFKKKLKEVGDLPLDKSVKTLKQELKDATNEAQRIAQQFGKNSEQFVEAGKRVANLKDEMQEFNSTVDSFNPDNKLQALVSLGKGAVGAVQGVAGAMTLLGVESENANQIMAKLQGLMALSGALNSVDDIKTSWKNFNLVISQSSVLQKANAVATTLTSGVMKGLGIATVTTSNSFKILKAAIISTGIGALIVAVGFLIEKISSWVSSNDDLSDSLKMANYELENQKNLTENIAETSKYQTSIELLNAKKRGASEDELLQIKRRSYERDIELFRKSSQEKLIKLNQIDGITVKYVKTLDDVADALRKVNALETKLGDDADEGTKKRIETAKNYLTAIQSDMKKEDAARKLIETEQLQREVEIENEKRAKQRAAAEKAEQLRKQAAEKLKQELEREREQFKKHQETISNIIGETQKRIAESKLNEKGAELFKVDSDFQEQTKQIESAFVDQTKILKNQLKNRAITNDQYNKQLNEATRQSEQAKLALVEDRNQKQLDVEKKYNKLITDFIDEYQQSAYQKSRSKIIEDFDAKIALADEKQKELLEKLKSSELAELDEQETRRKEVLVKETNLIQTETDNRVSENDTPEQRLSKLQAIHDAQVELENTLFAQKLETLRGQDEEIERAKAEHTARLTELADQQRKDEEAIDIAKKETKLANIASVSQATNALGQLVEQNTVAGKALAVASTTIDTYLAAQKAYTSQLVAGDPTSVVRASIAAASAVIAGLANVKKIVSVKVGKNGGGGSAPSVPPPNAPIINSHQLAGSDQIQDVRVVNQQDAVVKAYITNRDLQENEERTSFLNKLSSF